MQDEFSYTKIIRPIIQLNTVKKSVLTKKKKLH